MLAQGIDKPIIEDVNEDCVWHVMSHDHDI